MTEEERRQLVARFRAHEVVMWTDIDLAADEIERLAKRLEELEQRDRNIANDIRALARWI